MLHEKIDLIKYRMQRSKQTVQEAELAIQNDRLNLAENRMYYAIFYMVNALSITKNFSSSKHSSLKGWFNKEYVSTGIIDKRFYKIYNRIFDKRNEGDYDDFVSFERDEIQNDFKEMLEFLNEIEKIISENIGDSGR